MTWLRKCRKDRGLTVRALGKVLQRPHTWVSKIEICERRLDVVEFVEVCRALGEDPSAGIKIVERALGPYKPAAPADMRAADERTVRYGAVQRRK